jgi:O-antigen ligase
MHERMHGLRDWVWRHGSSVGAFMTPGLALWLPSGYSWGPVWLLLCALLTVDRWWPAVRGQWRDPRWAALAVLIVLMLLLWWIDTGPRPPSGGGVGGVGVGIGRFDMPSKYLLALPCLAFVLAAPPQPGALWLGVATGGIGGGITALVQRYGLDMERARGYTNEIQFGDIGLLLGVVALTVLVLSGSRRWSQGRQQAGWLRDPRLWLAWLAAGTALGLLGALLSQARGGWLALPLVWLAWVAGLWRGKKRGQGRRLLVWLTVLLVLMTSLLVALQLPAVEQRMALARTEIEAYEQRGDAQSSIGQRFAHWRVALIMGRERLALGWGSGYTAEKARLVEAGAGDPEILKFDHAHNEWLDMFARRGLIGVTLLAAWFALPILIFFPRRRDLAEDEDTEDAGNQAFVIRMTGLLLPVCYLGFGLTQVLFAHNSGHMMYLYGLVIWAGALNGVTGGRAADGPP